MLRVGYSVPCHKLLALGLALMCTVANALTIIAEGPGPLFSFGSATLQQDGSLVVSYTVSTRLPSSTFSVDQELKSTTPGLVEVTVFATDLNFDPSGSTFVTRTVVVPNPPAAPFSFRLQAAVRST